MNTAKNYLTPQEAATQIGVSAQMVRVSLNQQADGWRSLPFFKCGREIRIPKTTFERWLKRRERSAKHEAVQA